MTDATGDSVRIGTVDIPTKIERDRYFRELSYLELSLLFAGPAKTATLGKWQSAPKRTIGLVAPFPFTHRIAPKAAKLWPHDATTGDFRPSAVSLSLLAPLRAAADAVDACCIVFRSPEAFSPSAANREQLRRFFGEVAALGREIVWVPSGLWEAHAAIQLASELGATCAFDPLVRAPGEPLQTFFDLDVSALYLRIEGARSGPLRAEWLEDLAMLVEHYEGIPITVAFASAERWKDARALKQLLATA